MQAESRSQAETKSQSWWQTLSGILAPLGAALATTGLLSAVLSHWYPSRRVLINALPFEIGSALAGFYLAHLLLRGPLRKVDEALTATYSTRLEAAPADFSRTRETVAFSLRRTQFVGIVGFVLTAVYAIPFFFRFFREGLVYNLVSSVGAFGAGCFIRSLFAFAKIGRTEAALGAVVQTRDKIIESIGEGKIDEVAAAEQVRGRRDEERFQRNLGAPLEIKYFELKDAAIFNDLSWNLEPGINVLLGRNGFGKSFLLRLLVGMLSNDVERLRELVPDASKPPRMLVRLLNGTRRRIHRTQRFDAR
jgi:ABC-type multidrug transport system fused ATPase/permease subunit